ncbi:arylamine N-acetyltransferase [Streptomyces mashuensis]|uniref:Arylamine N-acetyltransferase n=1 Tax=Streptomyces mashuensis TaxID=33904 RepID=A0A919ASF5_9ACTN|nr:arylamine N-acetyltransferase [Streptomyces mashuensis]GHF23996.1 arylamine N-acetyltransferase [Streptomyces mashuensis]
MSTFLWSADELDLDAYLARIGYEGPVRPDLATLRAVHRAHVAAIPFENLEVILGRPVLLDLKSLQDKMVAQRRGGYCYEQNSLLAAALERIGFSVTGLGARVRMRADRMRPVTHMALRVEADGEAWLCDVGFGGEGLVEPLRLVDGEQAVQGAWTYALAHEGDGVHVLRTLGPEGWTDVYAFGPEQRFPVDYGQMNYYTSTHPDSPFVSRVIVQQTGPDVRRALVGPVLVVTRPDGPAEQRVVTEAELAEALRSEFGIGLGPEDEETLARVYRSRT